MHDGSRPLISKNLLLNLIYFLCLMVLCACGGTTLPESSSFSIVPNTKSIQPGEKFSYTINYKNQSKTNSSTIIITASFDEDSIFENAEPAGTKSNNHAYQWVIVSVQPDSEGFVTIEFHLANEVQPTKCSVALSAKIVMTDAQGATSQYTIPSGEVAIDGCVTPSPETETPIGIVEIDSTSVLASPTPTATSVLASPTPTVTPAVSTTTSTATLVLASPTPTTTSIDSGSGLDNINILLAILASIVGIIGSIIGAVQFFWLRSRKELSYFVIPKGPYFFVSDEAKRDMQVSLHGKPLKGDEIQVEISIINTGTEAISEQDLDLQFTPPGEILNAYVLRTNPASIENTTTLSFKKDAVTIKPDFLNSGESIDILVVVSQYSGVILQGRIKGGKVVRRRWLGRKLFKRRSFKRGIA